MFKRIIMVLALCMVAVSPSYAMMGGLQGRITPFSTFQVTADNFQAQQRAGLGQFPQGLTFYKDFTKVNAGIAGTFANSSLTDFLNANYSIGSPINTFTATNSSFTITSSGYQATTANDEVLKYLIAGNRTAAQETIVIKFTPTGNFANDGVARHLTGTDTKGRIMYKATTGTGIIFRPNNTDSAGTTQTSTTVPLSGVSYIATMACSSTGNPNLQIFINGNQEASGDNDDFTTNAWGTSFYLGSDNGGANQVNAGIEKIWIYNRFLSLSEIALHG